MQFVIAGDYSEYFAFLKAKGLPRDTKKFVFITDPTRLYSARNVKIVCTGRYWLSPICAFRLLDQWCEDRRIRFVDDSAKDLNLAAV